MTICGKSLKRTEITANKVAIQIRLTTTIINPSIKSGKFFNEKTLNIINTPITITILWQSIIKFRHNMYMNFLVGN